MYFTCICPYSLGLQLELEFYWGLVCGNLHNQSCQPPTFFLQNIKQHKGTNRFFFSFKLAFFDRPASLLTSTICPATSPVGITMLHKRRKAPIRSRGTWWGHPSNKNRSGHPSTDAYCLWCASRAQEDIDVQMHVQRGRHEMLAQEGEQHR